jgi:hypothetical protein
VGYVHDCGDVVKKEEVMERVGKFSFIPCPAKISFANLATGCAMERHSAGSIAMATAAALAMQVTE